MPQAGQAQAQREHHQAESGHHQRLLQLEAPAQRQPGLAQGQCQCTQCEEAGEHAGGVGQRVPARALPAFAALRQRQRLQRQHRQHAGHQVEDQAAEQRQQQGAEQSGMALGRGRLARCVGGRGGIGPRDGRIRGRGIDGGDGGWLRCRRWRRGVVGGRGRRGREAAGGQRDRQPTRHRRIADAAVLAALQSEHEGAGGGGFGAARHRQRDLDLVEVHRHVAEVFVVVGPRGRHFRLRRQCGGQPLAGLQRDAELVAVEVVARRRGQAQQQGIAVEGDHLAGVGLLRRQRGRIGLDGIAAAEQAAALASEPERAGRRGLRQRDLQRAGLRRIADPGIGATLVLHGQGGRGGARHGGPINGPDQRLPVGLDVAEEFVAMLVAIGQGQPRLAERRIRLHRSAVAVQVIAVGDLPADLDAVGRGGLRGQHENLVDGRQGDIRSGRRDASEQGERGQPAAQAVEGSGHRVSLADGFRRLPTAGTRAGRRRIRPRPAPAVHTDAARAAGPRARDSGRGWS